MQANPIINSFVGGVLSKRLAGRTDIQQYYQSAEVLENCLVECYGGAKGRPGLHFCVEVKTSAKATRLMKFVFSNVQAYILEVGDQYIRFCKNYGQIISGSAAYEISTPYLEADIWKIQIVGNADIAYVFCEGYPVYKLTRTAHTAWTLTAVDYSVEPNRPALMAENQDTTSTIALSGTSGSVTLTATKDLFDTASTSLHIGSIWKIHNGWVKITAVTDSKHATGDVLYSVSPGGTGPYVDWSEGAWSAKRGYPSCGTFNEQRLEAGGTTAQPQTTWGSDILSFEKFDRGTDDNNSIDYTISTEQVEVLKWLFPATKLAIGTEGGVHSFGAGNGAPVTPNNPPLVKRETTYRASAVLPKSIGSFVYYVQRYGRKLREFAYDLNTDSFAAADATVLSKEITESGIIDMDYQQEPDNILWCVLGNGKMVTFTRQIEQKVSAWSGPHTTDGEFESVCVIPGNSTEEHDQVWVIVKRTINGVVKRYIEYFAPPEFEDQEDAFFVDCGIAKDDPIVITGATAANPVMITTATAHGFTNGDTVRIRGVVGMTELNQRNYKVAGATTYTFTLTTTAGVAVNGTAFTAYEEAGEVRKCFRTLTGLAHLEGKTVKVCVEGGSHPDCVVSGGAITLNNLYSQGCFGLGYIPRIVTNDLELAASQGTSIGKHKRAINVVIKLFKTLGCKISKVGGTADDVLFRTTTMVTDKPPDLFSGNKEVSFSAGWEKECKIELRQELPLPFHVLAIIPTMEVNK